MLKKSASFVLAALRGSTYRSVRRTLACYGVSFKSICLTYKTGQIENAVWPAVALLNKNGLASHQAMNLLERMGQTIEMERRLANESTH